MVNPVTAGPRLAFMAMTLGAPIDWKRAADAGARCAPRPPRATRAEIVDTERGLASASQQARGIVADTAELPEVAGGETLVVDRPGWVRAACESFDRVFDDPQMREGASKVGHHARAAAAGAQTGAMMGWLSGRILGQFDPWADRLLLVAPNVVSVQRAMDVDPVAFRLWVCLHEETHRLQFATAPWLTEHLTRTAGRLVERVDGDWKLVAGSLLRSLRGEDASLLDVMRTDGRTSRLLDDTTAMMSLLEGHADVMMDRVGSAVVPGLARIRRRFEKRRDSGGSEGVIRRVLGLDVKLAQYRDGARFCRAVIDRIGVEGLNHVWSGPEQLPTLPELHEPDRWVRRVTAAG